jgi:hypothetical protein
MSVCCGTDNDMNGSSSFYSLSNEIGEPELPERDRGLPGPEVLISALTLRIATHFGTVTKSSDLETCSISLTDVSSSLP